MNAKRQNIVKLSINLIIALLLGFGLYKLLSNLAFGFASMLIVAIVFIFIEFQYYIRHTPEALVDKDGKQNAQVTEDGPRRRFSVMLVGCFGLVAVFAMSYYFYPSKEVFTNNDHHAIAVEGIETNHKNLILAANDRRAFFDDHTLAGSIELCDMSSEDSSATLHIRGAGMPIYDVIRENGICKNGFLNWFLSKLVIFGEGYKYYYVATEGQNNIHTWPVEEQLKLVNSNGVEAARLYVSYDYEKELKYLKLRKTWHSTFIIDYTDEEGIQHIDTSAFRGVIRNRYSLASLFPNLEPIHGVDLSKIELLRPKARTTNSWKDDEDLTKTPFLVCYLNNSGLGSLRSGDTDTPTNSTCDVKIKLDGEPHTIGIKSRIPNFRLTADTTGRVAIRYTMPMYRYLSTDGYEKGENGVYTFMITNSLVDESGEVNIQLPQNILLYDVFDNDTNIFKMSPLFISFRRGSTREPLQLCVLNNRNGDKEYINAGQRLPNIETSEDGTNWIVSLDNFRDSSLMRPMDIKNPISDIRIMGFMLLLTFLCCGSLAFKGRNTHTYIEPIAYIILISLLAIRLTLLWRASVFPPSSGISLGEFNKWRTGEGILLWIEIMSVLLVGLVLLFKRFGHFRGYTKKAIQRNKKNHNKTEKLKNFKKKLDMVYYPTFERQKDARSVWNDLWPQGNRAYYLLFFLFLYIVNFILGIATRQPLLCVGTPVLIYFVTDFFINVQVGSRWTDTRNHSYAFYWQGLINMLVASAVLYLLDSGYGLVFFIFAMLSSIIRFWDLLGANPFNKEKGVGIQKWGVFVLALLTIACLMFMLNIVIWMSTGEIWKFIVAGVFLGVFVAILTTTTGGWRKYPKTSAVFILLTIVFVSVGLSHLYKHRFAGSHTANRVMVLADNPSKVLGQVANTPDTKRFLEASLNDWVLEEYAERGKDVNSLIGEKGNGYFKLQPHSNVGVSWMTQLTDLSVSRFIIAEQSNLVPILLIFIFFIMTYVGLSFPSDRRWAKNLLIQIPLLMAIQSLMVWMAVTRRFVFVGQDFPMISLISRVNLCISIIGFLIWILTAILEYKDLRKLCDINKNDIKIDEVTRNKLIGLISGNSNNRLYQFIKRYTKFISLGIAALLFVIIIFGQTTRHFGSNNDLEEGTYDVADCVDAVKDLIANPQSDIKNIEQLFQNYQNYLIDSINKNRNKNEKLPLVHDITRLGPPQTIFKNFCNYMGYNPDVVGGNDSISQVFASSNEYGTFVRAIFNDYLNRQMHYNDVDGLIYIVKKRYVEEEDTDVENVRYTFGVTSNYFRQQLPICIGKSWRGNVTAEVPAVSTTAVKKTEGNVALYVIPSTWTIDNHQALIVKPSNDQLSVVGRYEPRQLKKNEAYYLSNSEVLVGRNAPDLSKYGSGNYIARNVLINSRPQFVYPMQSDFYWARPLAEQIRSYMQYCMFEAEKNESRFNSIMTSNSEVTLSIELTKELVNKINHEAPNSSVAVVVADGDGKVRALVEHRKPCYKVNPNDNRRVQFLEDSLKREGLLNHGHEAERFFGNKAILCLDNGPGSSQKPIVWTAVTTQYFNNDWDWNKLKMAKINPSMPYDVVGNGHYHAWSFAGARIKGDKKQVKNRNGKNVFKNLSISELEEKYKDKLNSSFRSIKGDEGLGNTDIDVQFYMRKSSNYYNAIMVYLGSHSREELSAGLPYKNPLFKKLNNIQISQDTYCDSLFPIIKYGSNDYYFAKPLEETDVLNKDAILIKGLEENFGLPSNYSKDRDSDLHMSMQKTENTGKTRIANYFAFPEKSYINNKARIGQGGLSFEIVREGIKMTALGKNSVWLVSPLKMAEMYGKLISFNSNYRLTIDPKINKLEYSSISTDGNNANAYLKMRNKLFIKGIHEVFTSSEGTAYAVYNEIENKTKLFEEGKYYIYGKTGTINGTTMTHSLEGVREKRNVEDHLLAVIITNKKLTELKDIKEYEKIKFYVIYIADSDYKNNGYKWQDLDPIIINSVLNSKEFKAYMEGE